MDVMLSYYTKVGYLEMSYFFQPLDDILLGADLDVLWSMLCTSHCAREAPMKNWAKLKVSKWATWPILRALVMLFMWELHNIHVHFATVLYGVTCPSLV